MIDGNTGEVILAYDQDKKLCANYKNSADHPVTLFEPAEVINSGWALTLHNDLNR